MFLLLCLAIAGDAYHQPSYFYPWGYLQPYMMVPSPIAGPFIYSSLPSNSDGLFRYSNDDEGANNNKKPSLMVHDEELCSQPPAQSDCLKLCAPVNFSDKYACRVHSHQLGTTLVCFCDQVYKPSNSTKNSL